MMKNIRLPNRFVGLHAHSVAGSIFDALGYPADHMDFCYKNGGDALALTDHGNMNGLAYQVLHAKKMQAEGKDFKPIFGVEAYFIPSIEEWREEYEIAMADKKRARSAKKDAASGANIWINFPGVLSLRPDSSLRRLYIILLTQSPRMLSKISAGPNAI